MIMKEISPNEIERNISNLLLKDWMLITAGDKSKINTMTIAWGGLGVFCDKDVAFNFVRPQRYTKKFLDTNNTYSLTVFPEQYREKLTYLGRVSGKDEDKISKSGLTVAYDGDTPYFSEAKMVIICKKMCEINLKENNFVQKELCDKLFKANDYHTLYISEIIKVMKK